MIEIEYYGGNCLKIKHKKATLITDDNLEELGLKSKTSEQDITLITSKDIKVSKNGRFTIDCPGDYEISGVSIKGIAAQSHLDESGKRATIYTVRTGDFSIAVLGHIHPSLSDDQLESIGLIDILILPVGGSGYTLDAIAAAKLTNKIDPKIVIPTHYADKSTKYPVPQAEVGEFAKLVGSGESETLKQLKIKESELGDKLRTVVVERS